MVSDDSSSGPKLIDALVERICTEFLHNPGLRLSCVEAQHLWGVDEGACRRAFDFLVEAGFLREAGSGTYVRLNDYPSGVGFARGV